MGKIPNSGMYCACKGTVVGWDYALKRCRHCQANWCEGDAARDQRVLAERQWQAPTKAAKPQQPCDHGLFSDEADQLDLVEMLQTPIEED